MRAIRYHEHGDVDVLRLEEVPKPEPGEIDIVARVHVSSVNAMDTYLRAGEEHETKEFPATPGSDFAGTVEAVGSNVEGYRVGDRVFGTGVHFHGPGSYAEFVRVPITNVALLPDEVSFEQGGAIGHVGITAWRSIIVYGDPKPGDACLIHGGSGGLGHIAVQLAAAAGCHVVTTTAFEEHCRQVESLGADTALLFHRDDLKEAVQSAQPRGFDIILDHMPERYLDFNFDVAADMCRLVMVNGHAIHTDSYVKTRQKELLLANVGSLSHTPSIPDRLKRLGGLIADGTITVKIADVFDLDEAAEAQRTYTETDQLGKYLIKP